MLRTGLLIVWLVSHTAVWAQFKNQILGTLPGLGMAGGASIAISPKNPLNIVAASDSDNVYSTVDGGQHWSSQKFSSTMGSVGSPLVIADSKGTFYLVHAARPAKGESGSKQLICHVSSDDGKTWDGGSVIASNPPKDVSHPGIALDGKGNVMVTWTQFDSYRSSDSACHSYIMMATSSNGKKWSKPVVISLNPGDCLDNDNTVKGPVSAAGDDKKIYVMWSGQNRILIDRSFDNGGMWLFNDIVVGSQHGGWSFEVGGMTNQNGLPNLEVEKLKGPRQGMLYACWADQRNGKDDTDIWFIRSANFGDNWTSPLRINNDARGKHQFMPVMTIDQTTGHLYILYYDRRDYNDNQTDVYLAWSVDSGNSFSNARISETPFVADSRLSEAYSLGVSASKGVISTVWTRSENDSIKVISSIIRADELPKAEVAKP